VNTNNFLFGDKWPEKARNIPVLPDPYPNSNVICATRPDPNPNIICATRPEPGPAPCRPLSRAIYEMEKLLSMWMEDQIQKRVPLSLMTIQGKARHKSVRSSKRKVQ
jgi:hypothetical protein